MMQPDLWSWTPPVIKGDRDGETFSSGRDLARLNDQARDVYEVMKDGEWRSLSAIAAHTGHPEASISARLRDLRKPKFGSFTVERRYIEKGLYHYRVLV